MTLESKKTKNNGARLFNGKLAGSKIEWMTLLSSSFLWRLSVYYMVVFGVRTCCENWAQLLITEQKKFAFISSFELGGMISGIFTGYGTDMLMQRNVCLQQLHTFRFLAIFGFLLGAALYGNINIFGIVATECAPENLSGSSHAVVTLAANSKIDSN
ncbi:unnamed protein product [Soboliphyme baturini]|uniref:MFS domain-containing protein n=1 Tax=Soboliphyme baturini TaxID=241478 RepID=A0A183JAZ9_9BILA|nr:unnamed protein product [Soboliphyme baturini]